MSSRAIEHQYGIGRKTVRKALASAWPAPRKPPLRASKLDPFKPVIDEILRADLVTPRKQRHTVTRIVDRLVDEHAMVGVSYQVVRGYVAQRRPEIRSTPKSLRSFDSIAAAAALGHTGQGAATLKDLAAVLEPLAGSFGATIFALGFFGAAFSSMLANATAGGTLLSDGLG
jgi:hypothetical protein